MVALIAMLTLAELILGEAAVSSSEALDADTLARLNIARRTRR
jgi:hypothetical protein